MCISVITMQVFMQKLSVVDYHIWLSRLRLLIYQRLGFFGRDHRSLKLDFKTMISIQVIHLLLCHLVLFLAATMPAVYVTFGVLMC